MSRVLALLPNWLGDVVMCTPALRALHQRFPESPLVVAGKRSCCALVEGLPYISKTLTIPARPGLKALIKGARDLRSVHARLAVLFPHSFRSALLIRLASVPERVGYNRNGRRLLLTQAPPPHRIDGRIQPIYMAEEYLDLVAYVGGEDDGKGLELAAHPAAVEQMCRKIPKDNGPVVGFAPGAAFGPSKRWLPDRFAAVADRLYDAMNARCILLTGPGEEDTREAVLAAARNPLILCDEGRPTIDSLKATISQLDLLVCNDSGPRHVAVAFNVPTVCVMGSTAPVYSEGPYEMGRVIRIDVDCGPCQKPECTTDHRCMTGITSERVFAAARDILKARMASG